MAITSDAEPMSIELQTSVEKVKRTIKTLNAFGYHGCNTIKEISKTDHLCPQLVLKETLI